MSESAENGPRTISSLLNIVALGRLVDLRVKLLFSTGVTVLTIVTSFAVSWFTPFLTMLYTGTRCRSVLIFSGTASFVLAIVVLRTGIALSAESWGPFTWFCLVVGQNVVCVLPLRVFIHQIPLFVQHVGSVHRFPAGFGRLHGLQLLDVVHWRTLIVDAVGECTVVAIFDAIATGIGVVNAHACFVVA